MTADGTGGLQADGTVDSGGQNLRKVVGASERADESSEQGTSNDRHCEALVYEDAVDMGFIAEAVLGKIMKQAANPPVNQVLFKL